MYGFCYRADVFETGDSRGKIFVLNHDLGSIAFVSAYPPLGLTVAIGKLKPCRTQTLIPKPIHNNLPVFHRMS